MRRVRGVQSVRLIWPGAARGMAIFCCVIGLAVCSAAAGQTPGPTRASFVSQANKVCKPANKAILKRLSLGTHRVESRGRRTRRSLAPKAMKPWRHLLVRLEKISPAPEDVDVVSSWIYHQRLEIRGFENGAQALRNLNLFGAQRSLNNAIAEGKRARRFVAGWGLKCPNS
jgi:hypothetical protein